MYVISENTVINAATRFLREYYKTRNELAWEWKPIANIQEDGGAFDEEQFEAALNELKVDLRTSVRKRVMNEDGILVDAVLTFYGADNQPFTVSLEATSFDKKQEVTYVPQHQLQTWDALSLTAIIITLLYATLFYIEGTVLHWIDFRITLLLIWVLFFLVFFGFRYLLNSWVRRYRYIYAVAQFKQYFANEQWIAIAEDVFSYVSWDQGEEPEVEGPEALQDRREYEELKRQCVKYGLGLIIVNRSLQTLLIYSPSRTDVHKRKRSLTTFLPWTIAQKKALERPLKKGKQFLEKAANPKLGSRTVDYHRYRRSYYHQVAILSICILIMGGMLWYEYLNPPIRYVDENAYVSKMERLAEVTQPERARFILDTHALMPFVEVEHSYLDLMRLDEYDQLAADYFLSHQGDHVEVFMKTGSQHWVVYDCARLRYNASLYYVSSGGYPTPANALDVIRKLRTWGIPASFFWEGCFSQSQLPEYRIVIKYFFEQQTDAEYLLKQLQRYQVDNSILGVQFELQQMWAY